MARRAMRSLTAETKMDVLRKVAQVIAENYGIDVIFKGHMAYTDGKTIVVPSLPEDAPDDLIEAIIGYIDHEVGHIRHTDISIKARRTKELDADKRLHLAWNAVEDVRQEHLMAKEFRGAGLNLEFVQEWTLGKIEKKIDAKEIELDPFQRFCILLIVRAKMLDGSPYAADFYGRQAGPLAEVIERLDPEIREFTSLPTTADAFEMSKTLLAKLDAMTGGKMKPEEGAEEPDMSGLSMGGGAGSGEPEVEKSIPDEGDLLDLDEEAPAGGSGSDLVSDMDEEGSSGSGSGGAPEGDEAELEEELEEEDGPEEELEEEDGLEEEEEPGGAGAAGEAAEEEEPEEGSAGAGSEDLEGEEEELEEEAGEAEGEEEAEGEVGAAEESEEEEAAGGSGEEGEEEAEGGGEEGGSEEGSAPLTGEASEALEELLSPHEPRPSEGLHEMIEGELGSGAKGTKGHRPYTTEFDRSIRPEGEGSLEEYYRLIADARPYTNYIYNVLTRVLLARTRSRTQYDRHTGRVNTSSISRLRTGQPTIFKRKQKGLDLDTYVELVIDQSGSMCGSDYRTPVSERKTKVELAAQTAAVLSEALDRVGVKFGVVGFTAGDQMTGLTGAQKSRMSAYTYDMGGGKTKGFHRLEPIIEFVYKLPDEPLSKARPLFPLMTQQDMENNADGDSILRVAKRVARRKEARKVIIVLSDGHPAAMSGTGYGRDVHNEYLKKVVKQIEHTPGMEVIGIGIMDDAVEQFYSRALVVSRISELPQVAMTQLKDALLAGMNKAA